MPRPGEDLRRPPRCGTIRATAVVIVVGYGLAADWLGLLDR
jgi:hypothetical protein